MQEFDKYSMMFQWICMFLSSLYALILRFNKVKDKSINGFLIYSLLALIFCSLSLIDILVEKFDFTNEIYIINIFSIFIHFYFFSYFFYNLFQSPKVKRSFIVLLITISLLLSYSVIIDMNNNSGHLSFIIANSFLVYCAITYYYSLFNQPPELDLLKMSAFWVASGIFFSMSVTLPIFLLEQLGYLKEDELVHGYLIRIGSIFYGIFHLFLVKAYSCYIKREKASIGLIS